MNPTSKFLLYMTAAFIGLGFAALPTGFGPAIFQAFGSALACLWGAWLFWDKKRN